MHKAFGKSLQWDDTTIDSPAVRNLMFTVMQGREVLRAEFTPEEIANALRRGSITGSRVSSHTPVADGVGAGTPAPPQDQRAPTAGENSHIEAPVCDGGITTTPAPTPVHFDQDVQITEEARLSPGGMSESSFMLFPDIITAGPTTPIGHTPTDARNEEHRETGRTEVATLERDFPEIDLTVMRDPRSPKRSVYVADIDVFIRGFASGDDALKWSEFVEVAGAQPVSTSTKQNVCLSVLSFFVHMMPQIVNKWKEVVVRIACGPRVNLRSVDDAKKLYHELDGGGADGFIPTILRQDKEYSLSRTPYALHPYSVETEIRYYDHRDSKFYFGPTNNGGGGVNPQGDSAAGPPGGRGTRDDAVTDPPGQDGAHGAVAPGQAASNEDVSGADEMEEDDEEFEGGPARGASGSAGDVRFVVPTERIIAESVAKEAATLFPLTRMDGEDKTIRDPGDPFASAPKEEQVRHLWGVIFDYSIEDAFGLVGLEGLPPANRAVLLFGCLLQEMSDRYNRFRSLVDYLRLFMRLQRKGVPETDCGWSSYPVRLDMLYYETCVLLQACTPLRIALLDGQHRAVAAKFAMTLRMPDTKVSQARRPGEPDVPKHVNLRETATTGYHAKLSGVSTVTVACDQECVAGKLFTQGTVNRLKQYSGNIQAAYLKTNPTSFVSFMDNFFEYVETNRETNVQTYPADLRITCTTKGFDTQTIQSRQQQLFKNVQQEICAKLGPYFGDRCLRYVLGYLLTQAAKTCTLVFAEGSGPWVSFLKDNDIEPSHVTLLQLFKALCGAEPHVPGESESYEDVKEKEVSDAGPVYKGGEPYYPKSLAKRLSFPPYPMYQLIELMAYSIVEGKTAVGHMRMRDLLSSVLSRRTVGVSQQWKYLKSEYGAEFTYPPWHYLTHENIVPMDDGDDDDYDNNDVSAVLEGDEQLKGNLSKRVR